MIGGAVDGNPFTELFTAKVYSNEKTGPKRGAKKWILTRNRNVKSVSDHFSMAQFSNGISDD